MHSRCDKQHEMSMHMMLCSSFSVSNTRGVTDVKNAFLNGYIEKEVYVRQPPGFESSKFPNHVFKLQKALYGLKQAPRAWYERLKSFLLSKGFKIGYVDKTLFLLKHDSDTLLF